MDGVLDAAVGANKLGAIAGMDGIGLAGGENFSTATDNRDTGAIAIFADIDAESAGLLNGEGGVGRINLVYIAFAHFTDAEIHAALSDADLGNRAIEVEERESGHAAEVKGDLAGLEFRTGVFVDPHLVGYGDGAVFDGVSPVALSPGLEGDGAFEKADASGAPALFGAFDIGGALWGGALGGGAFGGCCMSWGAAPGGGAWLSGGVPFWELSDVGLAGVSCASALGSEYANRRPIRLSGRRSLALPVNLAFNMFGVP
jgi:hypothetical protein